jgi:hypothetical protein
MKPGGPAARRAPRSKSDDRAPVPGERRVGAQASHGLPVQRACRVGPRAHSRIGPSAGRRIASRGNWNGSTSDLLKRLPRTSESTTAPTKRSAILGWPPKESAALLDNRAVRLVARSPSADAAPRPVCVDSFRPALPRWDEPAVQEGRSRSPGRCGRTGRCFRRVAREPPTVNAGDPGRSLPRASTPRRP